MPPVCFSHLRDLLNADHLDAPAVLANAIAVGVSYYMISGGLLIVGIPLSLLGAITFVAALFGYRE